MFTGLVESVGEVVEVKPTAAGVRLRIATPFAPEMMRVTTLGTLARGNLVNLERPLRTDGRFGGHFVQGHVDAVGSIEDLRADAEFHWLTVRFPPALAAYIVHK